MVNQFKEKYNVTSMSRLQRLHLAFACYPVVGQL